MASVLPVAPSLYTLDDLGIGQLERSALTVLPYHPAQLSDDLQDGFGAASGAIADGVAVKPLLDV